MAVATISSRALRLPLLGSRHDGELFEYLLLKKNEHSALISIPHWVISRANLLEGEKVSLHLKQYLHALQEVEGTSVSVGTQWNGYENLYRVSFLHPLRYVPRDFQDETLRGQLLDLIKDSFFLKNGILVLLKHLIPYFSRILKLSHYRYKNLRTALLDEVLLNVYENMSELDKLRKVLQSQVKEDREIPLYVNLENLRKIIQSEIDFSLFVVAFDNTPGEQKKLNQIFQSQTYSLKSHKVYLDAIKVTERRLYDNYNSIVGLFGRAFG